MQTSSEFWKRTWLACLNHCEACQIAMDNCCLCEGYRLVWIADCGWHQWHYFSGLDCCLFLASMVRMSSAQVMWLSRNSYSVAIWLHLCCHVKKFLRALNLKVLGTGLLLWCGVDLLWVSGSAAQSGSVEYKLLRWLQKEGFSFESGLVLGPCLTSIQVFCDLS